MTKLEEVAAEIREAVAEVNRLRRETEVAESRFCEVKERLSMARQRVRRADVELSRIAHGDDDGELDL